MIEVSAVEYDYQINRYIAIMSDGEHLQLESTDLRSAEQEAQRIADQSGEFSRFVGVRNWD